MLGSSLIEMEDLVFLVQAWHWRTLHLWTELEVVHSFIMDVDIFVGCRVLGYIIIWNYLAPLAPPYSIFRCEIGEHPRPCPYSF